MRRLLSAVDQFLGEILRWFSIVCMVILALVLTAVVFVRFVPIAQISWSDEAVEWAFAWMVFMGAAALWRRKEHFFVDALTSRLATKPIGFAHHIFVELLSAAFFIVFTYYSFYLTINANDRSPILEWPRPLWYACMPISGAIMAGYSIREIIKLVVGWLTPEFACPADMLKHESADRHTEETA